MVGAARGGKRGRRTLVSLPSAARRDGSGRVPAAAMLDSPDQRGGGPMSSLQRDLDETVTKTLHEHWRVLLAEGIILLLLGAAAIIIPPLAGLAVTIWLGAIFLTGGI